MSDPQYTIQTYQKDHICPKMATQQLPSAPINHVAVHIIIENYSLAAEMKQHSAAVVPISPTMTYQNLLDRVRLVFEQNHFSVRDRVLGHEFRSVKELKIR